MFHIEYDGLLLEDNEIADLVVEEDSAAGVKLQASGSASLLELAKLLKENRLKDTSPKNRPPLIIKFNPTEYPIKDVKDKNHPKYRAVVITMLNPCFKHIATKATSDTPNIEYMCIVVSSDATITLEKE